MARRLPGVLGGTALVLHGLAHALAGMQITAGAHSWWLSLLGIGDEPILWMATLLWSLAMTGFVAAGFGRLGAAAFRRRWRGVATIAALASLALLLVWPTFWAIPGAILDVLILLVVRGWPAQLLTRHRRAVAT